jgi:hypothetical protein
MIQPLGEDATTVTGKRNMSKKLVIEMGRWQLTCVCNKPCSMVVDEEHRPVGHR